MRIGEIDYTKDIGNVDIFLCKPDKTTIAKISEAYDIVYTTKISVINQLSFKIQTKIEVDRVFEHNRHIEMLKPRYLIRMVRDEITEYFVLTEESKNMDSSGKFIEYSVFSLGYELIDKNVRHLELESATLPTIANELLEDTLWSLGTVDPDFIGQGKHRSFEVMSKTVLQSIYDLAKVYNAALVWNTRYRTISFLNPNRVGTNRGFRFQNGKYLDSANIKIDSTNTVTRLKAYGKNGLDISEVTPNGMPYLESYKWYLRPFEVDEHGNILQSSYYFTDDLSMALVEYEVLLKENSGRFEEYLEQVKTMNSLIYNIQRDIADVKVELKKAWDAIDVSNAQQTVDENGDATPPPIGHEKLVEHKNRIQEKLNREEERLIKHEVMLDDIYDNIEKLRRLLSRERNFTPSQIQQLIQFTVEKEYSNDSIEDANDLLEVAHEMFEKLGKPKITARISIVNFLEVITSQHEWDKIRLGDDVYIKESDLETEIRAKITEIIYNFEERDITLVIENELDDEDDIVALIDKGNAGSTIVEHNKGDWDLTKEHNGMINDIINNHWDATKQAVEAGYKQLIEISERGIIVKSPDEECKAVIIQAGRIALTQDCGNTWKTAINPDGIWAEYLWGKVISGVNLIIEDESGIWKTQGSRTTIYNREQEEVMRLGLVTDKGADKECFGLSSWNQITKVDVNDCVGFAISRWSGKNDAWEKVFWAKPDGGLIAKDLIVEGIQIVNDSGQAIIDAEKNTLDLNKLDKILLDLVITPMEKIELARILIEMHEDFRTRYIQAQEYYYSQRDIKYDFEDEFDVTEQKFPVIQNPAPYNSNITPVNMKRSIMPMSNMPTPTPRVQTSDGVYLQEFTMLSKLYQKVLDFFKPFIRFKDNKLPQIKPGWTPQANRIDKDGFVTTNFVPEDMEIDYDHESMQENSHITKEQRRLANFHLANYFEQQKLFDKALVDMVFYSGLQMGEFYNNVVLNEHGFIAVRSDGQYRAFLNATHGLALQRWEKGKWRSKLYASLGNDNLPDGTLISEEMYAKKLTIEGANGRPIFDGEDLSLDLTEIEKMIYDDIISPPEKATLDRVYASIASKYVVLKDQALHYIETLYNDGRNIFPELTKAKKDLEAELSGLTYRFNRLDTLLAKVFKDMNKTTHIIDDLKMTRESFYNYFAYVDESYENTRNALENFITVASLQLGKTYNTTVIDAENGITVSRGDCKVITQLNATKGISIRVGAKGWAPDCDNSGKEVFSVDKQGHLFAVDIKTYGLRIIDAELGDRITFDKDEGITIYGRRGEVISLNANDAIKIDVKGKNKFRVGTDGRLYATDITTHGLKIVDGELGEKIIFDHNDGITINGNRGEQIRLNANEGIAINVKREKRIWIGNDGIIYAKKLYIMGDQDDDVLKDVNGSFISDLTVNKLKTLNSLAPQNFVHVEDNYIKFKTSTASQELTKLSITFDSRSLGGLPIIRWGAGAVGSTNANIATQYKDNMGFYTKYTHTDTSHYSEMNLKGGAIELNTAGEILSDANRRIQFRSRESIRLVVGGNSLVVNTQGVYVNGRRIDII